MSSAAPYTAALDRWLPWSARGQGNGERPLVEFSLHDAEPVRAPTTPPLRQAGPVTLWRVDSTIVLLGPRGLSGQADLDHGVGSVSAPAADRESAWKAVHGHLRLLWYLTLARHGLHAVHASGVVVDGGGAILIVGKGGAGKSTLAARMAGRGARLLSDDTVFADARTGRVAGMADSSRLFESPPNGPGPSGQDPDGKLTVPAPVVTTGPAWPRLMLFLDATPQPAIEVLPLDPSDAMAGLVRAGFASLDPQAGPDRLQTLARLAEACPAWRVSRGPAPPSDEMLDEWMEMTRA